MKKLVLFLITFFIGLSSVFSSGEKYNFDDLYINTAYSLILNETQPFPGINFYEFMSYRGDQKRWQNSIDNVFHYTNGCSSYQTTSVYDFGSYLVSAGGSVINILEVGTGNRYVLAPSNCDNLSIGLVPFSITKIAYFPGLGIYFGGSGTGNLLFGTNIEFSGYKEFNVISNDDISGNIPYYSLQVNQFLFVRNGVYYFYNASTKKIEARVFSSSLNSWGVQYLDVSSYLASGKSVKAWNLTDYAGIFIFSVHYDDGTSQSWSIVSGGLEDFGDFYVVFYWYDKFYGDFPLSSSVSRGLSVMSNFSYFDTSYLGQLMISPFIDTSENLMNSVYINSSREVYLSHQTNSFFPGEDEVDNGGSGDNGGGDNGEGGGNESENGWFGNLLNSFKNGVLNGISGIIDKLGDIIDGIAEFGQGIIDKIQNVGNSILEGLGNIVDTLTNLFTFSFDDFLNSPTNNDISLVNSLKNKLLDIIPGLEDYIGYFNFYVSEIPNLTLSFPFPKLTNTFKVDMEVKNVVLEPVSDILGVSQIETSNNSINLVSIILGLIYLCFRFAFLGLLFLFFKYIFSFLKYISHLLFGDNLHGNDGNVISLIVYIVFIIALFIFFGTLFSYVLDLSSFTTEILNLGNTIFSLFAVSFGNYDFYYNFVNTFTTGIYGLILLYIVYLITNKYGRLN